MTWGVYGLFTVWVQEGERTISQTNKNVSPPLRISFEVESPLSHDYIA